jgi:hypothetical protein
MEVMGLHDRDTMGKTCRRLCSRMEAIMEADGNFY